MKSKIMLLNIIISVLLLLIKYLAYHFSHSEAIYSDALESLVNVMVAILGLVIIRYSVMPPDHDHPYGHGKAELFSSTLESGLLIFAGIMIFIEALRALYFGHQMTSLNWGLGLTFIAGLANLLLGIVLKHYGKKLNSYALYANGQHLLLDFITSAVLMVGLVIIYFTGISKIDSFLALLMGGYIIFSGHKLLKKSLSLLMDAKDDDLILSVNKAFEESRTQGMIYLHKLKTIRSGDFLHIDGHLHVPYFWSVDEAHDRLENLEANMQRILPEATELNLHLDPCHKDLCKECDLINCDFRQFPFEERSTSNIHTLTTATEFKR